MSVTQKHLTLAPVWEADPFEAYPQLQSIWPEPFLATAREATVESLQEQDSPYFGGIFLILEGSVVVGITGFFFPEAMDEPFLRWHGIVPERRQEGLSRAVMEQLTAKLRDCHPYARGLTEIIPMTDYGRPLEKHFSALGFVKTGLEEFYDWSEYYWQAYRLPLRASQPMNKMPT